jgi:hypothetical protein
MTAASQTTLSIVNLAGLLLKLTVILAGAAVGFYSALGIEPTIPSSGLFGVR